MRHLAVLILLAATLSACGAASSAETPTVQPTADPSPSASTPRPRPTPGPRIVVSRPYAAFLSTVCHALAGGDASGIVSVLPYYQYNSGVYYGFFGDGEGQTGDPSIIRSWLSGSHVRCRYFAPDNGGHGAVLTGGWKVSGGRWALIELDVFLGHWKVNDFTFGRRSILYPALDTAGPILAYRG